MEDQGLRCPKCGADDVRLPVYIFKVTPMDVTDYRCGDCDHKWSKPTEVKP